MNLLCCTSRIHNYPLICCNSKHLICRPYITHNVLITHADFLKSTNKDKDLTLYRIFPTGGAYNYIGDVVALLTWYFVVVFIIAAIPVSTELKMI